MGQGMMMMLCVDPDSGNWLPSMSFLGDAGSGRIPMNTCQSIADPLRGDRVLLSTVSTMIILIGYLILVSPPVFGHSSKSSLLHVA
jgi:hypothetical protein